MSETKWTPGEWYLSADEQDERVSIASVVPGDVTIVAAHVHPCDAPLLLSAPDLYAALLALDPYLDHIPGGIGGLIDDARAALARARGETP